jgi:hypothetical protein
MAFRFMGEAFFLVFDFHDEANLEVQLVMLHPNFLDSAASLSALQPPGKSNSNLIWTFKSAVGGGLVWISFTGLH